MNLAKNQAEVLSDAFQEAGFSTAIDPERGSNYRLLIGDPKDKSVRHPDAALFVDNESNISILHDRTGAARKLLLKLGLKKHLVDDKALPFKSLEIIGRRWFQRTHGNTYHTAEIVLDGKTVHKTPKEYGYGEQYVASARDWLVENGYLPKRWLIEQLWHLRDNGIQYSAHAIDVKRERDL